MRLIIFILLTSVAAFGQDSSRMLTLESFVCKEKYGAGDTVVAEIEVRIPRGYHLYANPLGPGIGKPLNLYVNQSAETVPFDLGITWIEARKSPPKKYRPPIGDWVWAYDTKAYFFIKGVIDHIESGAWSAVYDVAIDALICRTECVPIQENIPFVLHLFADTVNAKVSNNAHREPALVFPAASDWQARYARAETMEFKAGPPQKTMYSDNGGGMDIGGIDLNSGIKFDIDLGGAININATNDTSRPLSSKEICAFWQRYKNDGGAGAADGRDSIAMFWGWDYEPLESKRKYNLFTAVLFALIAGLALNLTPCIFPVLGIRVLSFAESARESRRRAVIRSVAFAGGIISVFLLLAGFAAFAGLSWGQQFQNPAVMTGIIAMIFLFALGMFDFYTISVPSAIGNAERKANAGLTGDFLKGAAATVLATPCGGPFLGALLAWALLQSPLVIFTLFAVMGLGMAIPYIILSSNKKLMTLLPKPGRWIEDMKYAMGFLLLVFAVGMMRNLDQRLVLMTVGIALSILIAASVRKRFTPFGSSAYRRVIVMLISLALLAAGIIVSAAYLRIDMPYWDDSRQSIEETSALWQEFSPQALGTAHIKKRNVIVNFTAAWCSNCVLNKVRVLDSPEAQALYEEADMLLLTADLTNHNPQAQSLLHHLGSRSIPFLAIFPADSPENPVIMRDILSKDKYLSALKELRVR